MEIKRYLHCADNNHLDNMDKFAKVRPLYNLMNTKVNQFSFMHNHFSIDKQMVPYTGMHIAKQTLRQKSIRFGYKNFWLTSSDGYPYYCVPYTGAKGVAGTPGKDVTARITLQVALQLDMSIQNELFFDNWFSSYRLLAILTAMDIAATATIQNDRYNHCPIIGDSRLLKEDRGSLREVYDKSSRVVAIKWNDNSVVKMVSNVYAVDPKANAARYSKKEKKIVSIVKPNIVAQYNRHMGGVDYLDSKVAVYRITIRSKKWWWAHFINTLDCLMAASYMVYKLANPNEKHISYLEFIRRIVISYLPRRDVVVRRPIQRAAIWKGDNRVAPEPWPNINIRPHIMHFRRLAFSYTEVIY